eukprot:SAG31_NODE_3217_length_4537_cov_1.607481_6_plen_83_part_00
MNMFMRAHHAVSSVICGDGAVGKTSILNRYGDPDQDLQDEYEPTLFEDYLMSLDGLEQYNLSIPVDTNIHLRDSAGLSRNSI